MASPDLVASSVMDASASLLNDSAKTKYTYIAQIPFLNIALQELQEFFELNNIPVTDDVSAVIVVPTGVTAIGFQPIIPVPGTPYLPNELIEPGVLWERQHGVDPFTSMTRLDFLPRYMEGQQLNQFIFFTWQFDEIRVLPANQINDLKIDYTRSIFTKVTSSIDSINVINGQTFLEYRTASLCSFFIGENKTRADSLNQDASLGLDRVIGIGTKGRQAINIRHRPFRASYKRRTYM